MTIKHLKIENLAGLVRTGSVHRIFLMPYTADDGGGWTISVDHNDFGLSRELYSQRGYVRVFRTADAAFRALRECGYTGLVSVVMDNER